MRNSLLLGIAHCSLQISFAGYLRTSWARYKSKMVQIFCLLNSVSALLQGAYLNELEAVCILLSYLSVDSFFYACLLWIVAAWLSADQETVIIYLLIDTQERVNAQRHVD